MEEHVDGTWFGSRAERGMAALDAVYPGWWNGLEAENIVGRPDGHRIDLEELDLGSLVHCVLGQLFTTRQSSGWGHVYHLTGVGILVQYGFDSAPSGYEPLTAEWRELIAERRLGGAA